MKEKEHSSWNLWKQYLNLLSIITYVDSLIRLVTIVLDAKMFNNLSINIKY